MLREQESICNMEQMVTTGDGAGPKAGAQLEISMTFIFIFPYVAVDITANGNPGGFLTLKILGWMWTWCPHGQLSVCYKPCITSISLPVFGNVPCQ